MRSTTMMRALRVGTILAGLVVLPQFASAQLPIETKEVKIQAGATSTNAVTLSAPTVTTSYSLNFPAAQGTKGGFLYLATSSGQLAFSSTTGLVDGSTPVWDTTGGGSIVWEDPNGANNPNWSRSGNAISSTGKLGATSDQGFNIVTNNKVRIGFANDGAITVNTTTDGGATTTIGRAAGHTTAIDGATNITGATTVVGVTSINATGTAATSIGTSAEAGTIAIGNTGRAVNVTGTATVAGELVLSTTTATPFKMGTDGGASGEVLVSKGAGATPEWQNLTESIGIRKVGNLNVSAAAVKTGTISVTDLVATDAIVVTLEQSGDGTSVVVPMVTNRTNAASPGANGTFTVTFSGAYTGNVNYMILKALNN